MSNTRESIFKKLDAFIFKQVDLLKASPVYSKIQEPLTLMDDELRLVVNNSISLLLVIIPLIFIGVFIFLNYGIKQDIKMKKDILMTGQEIIVNRSEVNSVAQTMLSNATVDSDAALGQRLKTMAQGSSLDPSKIQVGQFMAEASFAKSNKISAMISISRFSTNELTNLFSSLLMRERMKISGMNIKKNEKDGQLEGTINVTFNSPPGMSEEEMGGAIEE
ncbi:MAG: hypothetical protein ACOYL6_07370 [Bacteriovoracaceae bacterium]